MKTTIQKFNDKELFDIYNNKDEVLREFSLVERRRRDLEDFK